MKKSILPKAMLSILMILFIATSIAQNSFSTKNKYRVSAYKKGNNEITSVSNEIEMMPPIDIYVPNAFTPNGDGLNDSFGAIGEGIITYDMQIYNRWGSLVFESTNPGKQWDGTFNNAPAESGGYVYKISAQGENKKPITITGNVTLVL